MRLSLQANIPSISIKIRSYNESNKPYRHTEDAEFNFDLGVNLRIVLAKVLESSRVYAKTLVYHEVAISQKEALLLLVFSCAFLKERRVLFSYFRESGLIEWNLGDTGLE